MYVYKYVSQCRNRAGRLASLRIVQARSSLPEVDAGKLGLPASCTPAPPKGVSATVFSPQKWLKCVKPYLTFSQPSTGFTSENRGKGVASSLRSRMSLHSLDSLVTCEKSTKHFPSRLHRSGERRQPLPRIFQRGISQFLNEYFSWNVRWISLCIFGEMRLHTVELLSFVKCLCVFFFFE